MHTATGMVGLEVLAIAVQHDLLRTLDGAGRFVAAVLCECLYRDLSSSGNWWLGIGLKLSMIVLIGLSPIWLLIYQEV
jgi:hypothetical protein